MKATKKHSVELYEFLLKLRSEKDCARALKDLLSPSELKAMTERLQIFKALLRGETQRNISKKLGVSIATVTRGSRVLHHEESSIQKFLN